MPTLFLAALTAFLHPITEEANAGEEHPAERTVRYAVLMENAEPLFAEVTCRNDRPCELIDHENPDIRLSFRNEDGMGTMRLSVSCGIRECFIWPRATTIDLRLTGKMLKFGLSEGRSPGHNAVLLKSRPIGQVVIAY